MSNVLICSICHQPVALENSKTDENGHAIHEDCYLQRLDPAQVFDTRVGCFGELCQVHLAGFSSRSNKLTEEFRFIHQDDDIDGTSKLKRSDRGVLC